MFDADYKIKQANGNPISLEYIQQPHIDLKAPYFSTTLPAFYLERDEQGLMKYNGGISKSLRFGRQNDAVTGFYSSLPGGIFFYLHKNIEKSDPFFCRIRTMFNKCSVTTFLCFCLFNRSMAQANW